MRQTFLALVLPLALLSACVPEGADSGKSGGDTGASGSHGGGKDSGAGDSGAGDSADSADTDTGEAPLVEPMELTSDVDVNDAYTGQFLPAYVAALAASGVEGGCPSKEFTDGFSFVVSGGCTSDSGVTWYGSATYTSGSGEVVVEYHDFGLSVGSSTLILDGTITQTWVDGGYALDFAGGSIESSDGAVYSGLTGSWPAYGRSARFDYDAFNRTETTTGAPEVTVSGSGVLDGTRSISWSGAWVRDDGECGAEPISGSLDLVGAQTVTMTFAGMPERNCDGCWGWTSTDGSSGTVCEQ